MIIYLNLSERARKLQPNGVMILGIRISNAWLKQQKAEEARAGVVDR